MAFEEKTLESMYPALVPLHHGGRILLFLFLRMYVSILPSIAQLFRTKILVSYVPQQYSYTTVHTMTTLAGLRPTRLVHPGLRVVRNMEE